MTTRAEPEGDRVCVRRLPLCCNLTEEKQMNAIHYGHKRDILSDITWWFRRI